MGIGINNTVGLNTVRNLSLIKRSLSKTMQRLSSGLKINQASDGPAELVISEQMWSQIGSLTQSVKNLEMNINRNNVADSAITELRDKLKSIRTVALAAANEGSATEETAAAYQQQLNDLVESFNSQRNMAVFGEQQLLDGSNDSVADIDELPELDVSDLEQAKNTITKIDQAISHLDSEQVKIGSMTKQEYESTIRSLEVSSQNLVAAESVIRNTDYALEQTNYIKQMIQLNAGLATLAQGNLVSESVYKLMHI
ncbi:MAG: hypothetical protein KAT58_07160 [candidate division Zixibacteria bacterium]|nr:hypothetical protein [candidate division Zixibacteria bacterium]